MTLSDRGSRLFFFLPHLLPLLFFFFYNDLAVQMRRGAAMKEPRQPAANGQRDSVKAAPLVKPRRLAGGANLRRLTYRHAQADMRPRVEKREKKKEKKINRTYR